MATIKVGKLQSRDDEKGKYVIVKGMPVPIVVWNGKYLILVIKLNKQRHILNVQYRGAWWGCTLDNMTDDQAALAAAPFFEAVKAGHDSFEVQE